MEVERNTKPCTFSKKETQLHLFNHFLSGLNRVHYHPNDYEKPRHNYFRHLQNIYWYQAIVNVQSVELELKT